MNKEKYYKLEINQFDCVVLNSYPQTVIDIKNKKNKSIIKLKTHGTLNEYNLMSSNINDGSITDAKKCLQSREMSISVLTNGDLRQNAFGGKIPKKRNNRKNKERKL